MSEPFLAEIRMFGFNFPPRGWALCDGQILPINQNQSLYSLLGTTYGGDGRTTFALPDLRGRVPIHVGQADGGTSRTLGSRGGEETHTLTVEQAPAHGHALYVLGSDYGPVAERRPDPGGNVLAPFKNGYADAAVDPDSLTALRSDTVSDVGGGSPHSNIQPEQVISFAIALQGLFPSRN